LESDVTSQPQPKGRIDAIDITRGAALVAMAIYHFTWDLEFFGYVPPAMTAVGGWKLFARCIASSFLFLVGVSLFLGHAKGIRWRGYWRRLAMVAGAALAISLVTYIAVPSGFIFFGILHQIALASLLGLLFLRLPAMVTLIAAAAVIASPHYLRSGFFDDPWWWWTGLSENRPRSNDYVPVFPWFGAVLIGIAAAKIAEQTGLFARLATLRAPKWSWPLVFSGRHSEVRFLQSCEAACNEQRDTEFCTRYCVCMLGTLEREGAIEGVYAGERSEALQSRVEDIAGRCTVDTDNAMLEGGG
jgi:uncharacterized membrane protein